jgi:hypothetical protein
MTGSWLRNLRIEMRKPILEPNYLVAIYYPGEHDRRTARSASCAKRTVAARAQESSQAKFHFGSKAA